MERQINDIEELKKEKYTHKEYLRKQKINKFISLKRSIGANDQNYTIKVSDIIIKQEFKEKRFNTLLDLLSFSSSIFQNENSDINDIKFIIYLLKQTQIKNDTKDEINSSNILKDIAQIFKKYIENTIIIDELLGILINFSYFFKPETNMNLLTDDYMKIYSTISAKYFTDNVIFNDLIVLLGNLANDNPSAQKIFYNTKLFDELYKLSKEAKAPTNKRDVAIYFLGNFTVGISRNKHLINNIQLLKDLVDILCLYINQNEYSKICLISLGELSDIKDFVGYFVNKKEIFEFIHNNNNPDYFWPINKILVNLTFVDDKINLIMIETYNTTIFPYLFKILNSSSKLIQGQGFFLLGNLLENHSCKINDILNKEGFYDKIFENMDSLVSEIIDKVTFLINIITSSSDNEGIFQLYKKKIHLKLINILKNNYRREIIDRTIDAIIDFLQKDTHDGIIRQSFIDNGIKEVLNGLEIDRNDAELYFKTEEIIKNYF